MTNDAEKKELPDEELSYYIHKDIVENRDEEIIPFFKKMKNVVKERYWDLSNSVFKDWRKDNESIYEKCLEHDFKFWKVPKFLKDPDELEEVKKIIKAKLPILKDFYQYLIAISNFPGIVNFDFM